jgi:hypothetical protein
MEGAARADAAAIARSDGVVMVFGGRGSDPGAVATSARLDYFQIGRRELNTFQIAAQDGAMGPADTARSRAVMVQVVRPVFAFGGLGLDDQALDTVVNIDPQARPGAPVELATRPMGETREVTRMSAPRVDHTASLVTVPGTTPRSYVLVFGGAPPGGPVADLFDPADQTFPALDRTGAGPGRKHHAALTVTVGADARLLLLGGQGDDGAPRGDSVLFDPATRSFAPGPITLRTPRYGFTAFVVGNDLVVMGGVGADGKRLATGEVYDAKALSYVGEIKGEARSGAIASPLPNLTVMLIGGVTDASSSSAIEIYQPRMTPS